MELRINQAILHRNTAKRKGSKQPDYIGTINFDGAERQLQMWVKKAKTSGNIYLFGTNSPFYEKPQNGKNSENIDESPDAPI